MKNAVVFSGGKSEENGPVGRGEKKDTGRARRESRRTREEIVKWNQMTALRFQTGEETSDIPSLPECTGEQQKHKLVVVKRKNKKT